MYYYYL